MNFASSDFDWGIGIPMVSGAAPTANIPMSNAPVVQVPGVTMPQIGGGGLFAGMSGMDKANLALGGLQTIGNLWAAFQAQKLAKKQFRFTKDITETNLANQIKSYNTTLQDRARSRAAVEGQSAAQMQSYIDANSLSRKPKT